MGPRMVADDLAAICAQVKPVLDRLKTTLLASGGGLLLSGILLVGLITTGADADGVYGAPLCMHTSLCLQPA